jgi:hypothetical protein
LPVNSLGNSNIETLIHAAVVTLFAASTAQAQQAVQWRVQDGGNGHWYRVVPSGLGDWDVARTEALGWGADLASIGSAEENVFARNLLNAGGFHNFFIGALVVTGNPCDLSAWRWSDGTTWTYANWDQTQPDCNTETRVTMYTSGVWHNYLPAGQGVAGAIFEWSADCNGDGIVDYGQCRDGSLPDYNGNNVPDCCESGTACVVGNYPVQWRVAEGGNGHWYQLSIQQLGVTWPVANLMSRANGGRLAQIENATERQHLFDLCASSSEAWNLDGGGALGPWMGGLQQIGALEPSGGWTWTDGTPVDFAACGFVASDPSGCGVNEDRMSFWCPNSTSVYVGSSAYETSDFPAGGACGTLGPVRAFITEWSADCNGDGIVDYGQILQGQLADTNQDGVPDICQQPTCADADLFRDFNVNGADLGILLSQWGPNTPLTESDLNNDGVVNGADLGLLLSFWGACP